ncbi:hypothetical protein F4809DRAFT_640312 [Biscogniauxia mediterranea]|nr:hypothetical protein F4809DRAFT_640312 [Biscogniauxia mediterranea]
MQHMLEWLWDCVAEPILDNLGFKSVLEDGWPQEATTHLGAACFLTDWETAPLTVGSLIDTNVGFREQSRFLAYLSACGTGRTDFESLSGESIHQISAFQLAGF